MPSNTEVRVATRTRSKKFDAQYTNAGREIAQKIFEVYASGDFDEIERLGLELEIIEFNFELRNSQFLLK